MNFSHFHGTVVVKILNISIPWQQQFLSSIENHMYLDRLQIFYMSAIVGRGVSRYLEPRHDIISIHDARNNDIMALDIRRGDDNGMAVSQFLSFNGKSLKG